MGWDVELLQRALSEGIIDLGDVENKVIAMKRKNALAYHKHKIWFTEKSQNWYTYLPDPIKGRRLIRRKTRESLEDAIAECYLDIPDPNARRKIWTLEKVYEGWMVSKSKHTNASSFLYRISADWQRFYKDSDLAKMPISQFTKRLLDDWVHEQIQKYKMTKTCYYNMSIILRQGLQYAKEMRYIKENPFEEVKVDAKMFWNHKKREDGSQVFLEEEQQAIEKAAMQLFWEKPYITNPLAICLAFQLGTRPCETVALKTTDIENGYIHVQRMEVRKYEYQEDGKTLQSVGVEVVPHTKSSAGDRRIYLTVRARKIIQLILASNVRYHNQCEDYLFVRGGERVEEVAVTVKIGTLCTKAGIPIKRCHKIRKTWISTLIDSDLNISKIREMAGHTDERTTYRNYCYNRKGSVETENIIERALCSCEENHR